MLVLTRKLNQSITLGDNVRLTVLAIENDRVSIGVDAPREVRIFRSELLEGTRKSNQESFASQYIPVKMMTAKKAAPPKTEE
ncbi:hypothetical protein FACS18949_07870 [Clostridia bacterium]|nr:hypothetical protein FACS18949_07870 [Clostridia bacterium]